MTVRDPVERYYDRNTLPFLILGGSRGAYALHRRLWGPGVSTAKEASGYVNFLVAEELSALGLLDPLKVLDLGCGVGGTLFQLAERLPRSRLYGVTISRSQHRIAERIRARKGLEGRCRFTLGDFHTVRLNVTADVVIAIESFVHSRSPASFFEAADRHLAEGGHVIVVDDFLARPLPELGERAARHVADFEAGWHLSSLCTLEEFDARGREAGLERIRSTDLTDLIEIDRPRDRVIDWAGALLRRLKLTASPLAANLVGSSALHAGIREGLIRYRSVTLRKRP